MKTEDRSVEGEAARSVVLSQTLSRSGVQTDGLTFRFSRSLAASFGWLNRNMLVLPSRITAPGAQRAREA